MDDYKPCPICGRILWDFIADQGDKWGRAFCADCDCGSPEVRTEYDLSDNAEWHYEAIDEFIKAVRQNET